MKASFGRTTPEKKQAAASSDEEVSPQKLHPILILLLELLFFADFNLAMFGVEYATNG